jgi:hypothetical protein
MTTDLTSIIVTIVSSGVGAGIVTFCMNFWKAELDFRRAKIEELYACVDKNTAAAAMEAVNLRTGRPAFEGVSSVEDLDRSKLLIALYFPRLLSTFTEFETMMHDAFTKQELERNLRSDREGVLGGRLAYFQDGRQSKGGNSCTSSPRKFARVD